jgi:hypothetical protein
MKHQHLSQTKNAIASSNRENATARSSTHPIEELQGAIGDLLVQMILFGSRSRGDARPDVEALAAQSIISNLPSSVENAPMG